MQISVEERLRRNYWEGHIPWDHKTCDYAYSSSVRWISSNTALFNPMACLQCFNFVNISPSNPNVEVVSMQLNFWAYFTYSDKTYPNEWKSIMHMIFNCTIREKCLSCLCVNKYMSYMTHDSLLFICQISWDKKTITNARIVRQSLNLHCAIKFGFTGLAGTDLHTPACVNVRPWHENLPSISSVKILRVQKKSNNFGKPTHIYPMIVKSFPACSCLVACCSSCQHRITLLCHFHRKLDKWSL